MKFLVIAGLLLSSAVLSVNGAGTQDFCQPGVRILATRTVSISEDLTNYRGIQCETDPNVDIVLDATNAPNGFGITVTFSDGTIGSGGSVHLKGPSEATVMLVAPTLFRIERNIFEPNAVLYVTGNFPVSSLISISNNKFDVSQRHNLFSTIGTNFIAAVAFGAPSAYQFLMTNSQTTIYDNEITVTDAYLTSAAVEVYGIYVPGDLYLANDAGFLVQRNNVTVTSRTKSIGVYCPRYAFSMGNKTLTQISNNRITAVNGIMMQTPAIAIDGLATSEADFSRNIGILKPIFSNGMSMVIGPCNLTLGSSVEIADNDITNEMPSSLPYTTRIFVNGPVHLRNNASFRMWFNTIRAASSSPQLTFAGDVRPEDNSKMLVVGNDLVRSDQLVLTIPPLSTYSLSIKGTAQMTVSQNKVGAANGNARPLFWTVSNPNADVSKSAEGSLDICHNLWYGQPFTSDAALTSLLSPKLRPIVNSLDRCPAVITTTPMPTTVPTTTTVRTQRPQTTTYKASANGAPSATNVFGAVAVGSISAAFFAAVAFLF